MFQLNSRACARVVAVLEELDHLDIIYHSTIIGLS